MTRRNWMGFAAMLVAGLFLAGCGGDDNGLSSEDMARIAAAEDAAMMAQEDAAAAHEEAEEAKAEAAAADAAAAAAQAEATAAKADAAAAQAEAEKEVVIPETDTSEIDAAIDALEVLVADLAAEPLTPVEILSGAKGTGSAADLSVAATKIAGQLNATFDHDGDEGLVNLPEIPGDDPDGTPADLKAKDAVTRDIAYVSSAGISSADGTSKDKGFLKHTFTGGPTVDLTSPGDIETLKLGNLLKVNGVDLKSFSIRETDKIMVEIGPVSGVTATATVNTEGSVAAGSEAVTELATGFTRTTTLGSDGSMSVVTVNNVTGKPSSATITTFVGGARIVEGPGTMATIYGADGSTLAYAPGSSPATDYMSTSTAASGPGGTPSAIPATDLSRALMKYKNAKAPKYALAQHAAAGYGAWLEDSFFVAYVISAEDDAILSDPDDMAMKVAWGGRAYNSARVSHLSGRGATAMWKGLMVGHDIVGEEMVKGNASVTARVSDAVLADQAAAGRAAADVLDVSLTNIITADGTAVSRVAEGIHWTDLDLIGGWFAKGDEIQGAFYDSGNEVVGEFEKEGILGVFGAMEYEMEEMMDMASQ